VARSGQLRPSLPGVRVVGDAHGLPFVTASSRSHLPCGPGAHPATGVRGEGDRAGP
jgi:hypothetical protein